MKKSFFISCFLLILTFSNCKKEVFEFPYVPVRLDLGIYSDLAMLGNGSVMFKPGYGVKGLIIFRDYTNNYFVFDRACTYEKDFSCQVDTTSVQGLLKCKCCESRYLIGESSDPLDGPASYPLVRYNAVLVGDFLRISN